jgi:hypothetical protein
VVLFGNALDLPVGSIVQLSLLQEASSSSAGVSEHSDIAALLSEFDQLF